MNNPSQQAHAKICRLALRRQASRKREGGEDPVAFFYRTHVYARNLGQWVPTEGYARALKDAYPVD